MKFLWQQIPSPLISELLCKYNDFDGVVLDTEHGVFSNETLYTCIQMITNCNKKCFVRITEPDKTLVRYCLDSGSDGLIFSTIETINQVREVKSQCTFPIVDGKRGYGLTRDNFWGEIPRKNNILIAQIETLDGVKLLKEYTHEMLRTFNYFLIGPYDLSSSLKDEGNFKSEKYKNIINTIKQYVGEQKTGYHIVKNIEEQYKDLEQCGFLAFSMDTLMIIENVKKIKDIL